MRPNYTLPRLYLTDGLSGEITLSREQSHYVGTVLRRGEGDEIRLFNDSDGEWAAEIISANRKSVIVRVDRQLRDPYAPPDIRLLFAPIRKHRMTTVIEKATELGVTTLQPVITAHTQFPKVNLDRTQAQIVEAAEQTERLDLPVLKSPISFDEMLQTQLADRPLLFADEAGDGATIISALASLLPPLDIIIGPEGGFSPDERDQLRARNATVPISLGPRILRADTAAISVLTLVQAIVGDWRS